MSPLFSVDKEVDTMRIVPAAYTHDSAPLTRTQGDNATRSLVISGASLNVDFFSFSRTGLALGNLSTMNDLSIWDSKVTAADDDDSLKLMDKSIAEVGGILEQMRSLSELAEDEELTELDRIDMQIDMQRLQNKLAVATRKMSLRMSGQDGNDSNMEEFVHNNGIDRLLRARERILNGEKWDAAETYEAQYTVSETKIRTVAANGLTPVEQDEDGKYDLTKYIADATATLARDTAALVGNGASGEFELSPEVEQIVARVLKPIGGVHKVTDDPNVPTLKALLQQDNAIILMDAESAKEGTEKLDAELKDLLALKEDLRELRNEEYGDGEKLFAETVMTESDIQEMLGQISREKQEESERIQEERDREATGGQAYENAANVNPSEESASSGTRSKPIRTDVGTMLYDEETGLYRLVSPENKKGRLFSKLERFFLDGIGKRCATPLGGKLQNPTLAPTTTKII